VGTLHVLLIAASSVFIAVAGAAGKAFKGQDLGEVARAVADIRICRYQYKITRYALKCGKITAREILQGDDDDRSQSC
jgi:hypothetical protein